MTRQIDREAALERVAGDVDLLREIAHLFLEDAPSMQSAIEKAAAEQDAKVLERAAHTLKGCVSNFGAAHCYEAAFFLEKLARSGDFSGLERALQDLRASLDELRPELEALAAE